MNVSPSRILDLPLEESDGQGHQHNGKSGQDKNIRIDARESRSIKRDVKTNASPAAAKRRENGLAVQPQ
jgi:hypothetical protein